MAPIHQLGVLAFASVALAVPHVNLLHPRHAHPGSPGVYKNPPPPPTYESSHVPAVGYSSSSSATAAASSSVAAASSSAAASPSSSIGVYGSSSAAASASSVVVASSSGAASGSSVAAGSSSLGVYGSSSVAAGSSSVGASGSSVGASGSSVGAGSSSLGVYGSSSSVGAASVSSSSYHSGFVRPTGGYSWSGSSGTGYVSPTGHGTGSASYSTSVCTETTTLIYRSSTTTSTYYVTHTIYASSSVALASSSAAGGSGGGSPSGAYSGSPGGGSGGSGATSSVQAAGSGSPGGGSGGHGQGSCVPDVTVTKTEKTTVYVTAGQGGGHSGWGTWESNTVPASSSVGVVSSAAGSSSAPVVVASSSASAAASTYASPSSAAVGSSSAPAPSSNGGAPSSAVQASSSVAAPSSSAPAPSGGYGGATGYRGKRGLGYNDVGLTSMFESSQHVGWAYNWLNATEGLSPKIPFIPMLHDGTSYWTSGWDKTAEAAIANGAEYFFCFNEPDMPSGANLSPSEAAGLWKQYMEPYAGKVKLVAPSVTNGQGAGIGVSWLEEFLHACSDCTIDSVNQHWYWGTNDVHEFKRQIGETAKKSGRPVWVSEFGAVGTDQQRSSFLKKVMPWMDSNDDVLGYAYFMVSDGLLCDGSSPSAYGETYMNFS